MRGTSPAGRAGGYVTTFVAALGCLAAVLFAAPHARAEVALDLRAGFDGYHLPGSVVPVRVRIASDSLIRGSLEAEAGSATVTLPVEVSAGSPKEHLLLVPTSATSGGAVRVAFRDESGRPVADTEGRLDVARDQEIVGLLPGVLAGRPLPGVAPLAVDAGTARFVVLDEALLAGAPQGLYTLGTIAADAEELGRLPEPTRRGLLMWVSDGGRLLLDAPLGTVVAGLPDEWQPGAEGRRPADAGEVVLTAGALAAGRWSEVLEPTPRGRHVGSAHGFGDLPNELAAAAGLTLPNLNGLVVLLALYTVVVGPLTYLVLRHRRREILAWVVVPVAAVLFAGMSYLGARSIRTDAPTAHGSILLTSPAGSRVSTIVGVTSTRGGHTRIAFPAGWHEPRPLFFDPRLGGGGATVGRGADGSEVRIPMNPGQFALAIATGALDGGLRLAVEGRTEGGGASGTVRNDTPYTLRQAAVFVGRHAVPVGTLGPGETQPWTAEEALLTQPVSGSIAARLWGRPGGAQAPDDPVNHSLWRIMATYGGVDLLAPGRLTAVGWTSDHRPEVTVNGTPVRPEGTTLVVGQSRVQQAGGPISPAAVSRVDVRTGELAVEEPGVVSVFGGDGMGVVRVVLPEPAEGRHLLVSSPRTGLQVWHAGAWQPLQHVDEHGPMGDEPVGEAEGPVTRRLEVAPPPDPFPGGGIRVRGGLQLDHGPPVDHELPPMSGRVIYLRIEGIWLTSWDITVREAA